jgi:hypothetical protein
MTLRVVDLCELSFVIVKNVLIEANGEMPCEKAIQHVIKRFTELFRQHLLVT